MKTTKTTIETIEWNNYPILKAKAVIQDNNLKELIFMDKTSIVKFKITKLEELLTANKIINELIEKLELDEYTKRLFTFRYL